MDFKNLHNKYSDEEWEKVAQQLLNAKFDQEKQVHYQTILVQEGIHRGSPAKKQISLRTVLSIAASLLILLALGWYLSSPSLSDAQQLTVQYLEQPFAFNEGNTRGQAQAEQNRGKAAEAYNNEQYEKALKYLQLIEAQDEALASDYFQMGLCLMYQKKPDYQNALKFFDKVKSTNPGFYEEEINWFSAFCYIMLSNNNEAKSLLNKVIQSPGSRQQEKAQKLLDKLTVK